MIRLNFYCRSDPERLIWHCDVEMSENQKWSKCQRKVSHRSVKSSCWVWHWCTQSRSDLIWFLQHTIRIWFVLVRKMCAENSGGCSCLQHSSKATNWCAQAQSTAAQTQLAAINQLQHKHNQLQHKHNHSSSSRCCRTYTRTKTPMWHQPAGCQTRQNNN